jgi:hypothetical protein
MSSIDYHCWNVNSLESLREPAVNWSPPVTIVRIIAVEFDDARMRSQSSPFLMLYQIKAVAYASRKTGQEVVDEVRLTRPGNFHGKLWMRQLD